MFFSITNFALNNWAHPLVFALLTLYRRKCLTLSLQKLKTSRQWLFSHQTIMEVDVPVSEDSVYITDPCLGYSLDLSVFSSVSIYYFRGIDYMSKEVHLLTLKSLLLFWKFHSAWLFNLLVTITAREFRTQYLFQLVKTVFHQSS